MWLGTPADDRTLVSQTAYQTFYPVTVKRRLEKGQLVQQHILHLCTKLWLASLFEGIREGDNKHAFMTVLHYNRQKKYMQALLVSNCVKTQKSGARTASLPAEE